MSYSPSFHMYKYNNPHKIKNTITIVKFEFKFAEIRLTFYMPSTAVHQDV